MFEWRAGMKCVCVDDRPRVSLCKRRFKFFSRLELLDHNLNLGDIYTISAIEIRETVNPKGEALTFRLMEAAHFRYPAIGFPSFQFRPLVTRSTESGMAILRKIADDVTRKGRVPA